DVGPEPGAVLADPDRLLPEAALRLGDLQVAVGLAGLHLLREVEAREVMPHDLAGFVALDALGARVPGRHPTPRVEHVNRVVLAALHQEAEALLALAQRPLRST